MTSGGASHEGNRAAISPFFPWIVWSLGALFYCYGFFQRVAPSVMVAELMRDFTVGAAILGNLSAFFYYAYAGVQLPVGILVDRYGARSMLTAAAILCALGSLLFATTDSLWLAYLGRLLIGAGAGFTFVGTLKLGAVWFPPRRFALLTGMTLMMGMVGGIGAQAPLAAAVAVVGWRATLIAAAAAGLLLALVIWSVVRERPGPGGTPARAAGPGLFHGLGQVLRAPHNWIIGLFTALMTASMWAFAALWGVPYMMQTHGLDRPEAAISTSMLLIGWAVGSPVAGWFSDFIGRRKLPMLIGAVGALVAFVALVYLPGLPLPAVRFLIFANGFFSGSAAVAYALAREHNPPDTAGVTLGCINAAVPLSASVFQPLVGWLLDLGWDGSMIGGARIYAPEAFRSAFLPLIAAGIVAVLAASLVRESWCRPVSSGYSSPTVRS